MKKIIRIITVALAYFFCTQTYSQQLSIPPNETVGYIAKPSGWCGTQSSNVECKEPSGTPCITPVKLNPNFKDKLLKLINAKDDRKLKEAITLEGWKALGLESIDKLKSGETIKKALVSGQIVIRLMKETKAETHLALVTAKSINAKNADYVGHVTLLK